MQLTDTQAPLLIVHAGRGGLDLACIALTTTQANRAVARTAFVMVCIVHFPLSVKFDQNLERKLGVRQGADVRALLLACTPG